MALAMEPIGLNLPLAYLVPALVFLAVFYLAKSLTKNTTTNAKAHPRPPGPWGFPLVGHLPLLGLEPYKTAMAWKAKYGPIVGLRFGSYPAIIISDYKLAKEALASPAFAGRPQLAFASDRSGGGEPNGIVMSQGRIWREQRTFTHKRLRELGGFGTRSMEPIINKQVEQLVARLQGIGGASIDLSSLFHIPVLNVVWSVVAGHPFDLDDPKMLELTRGLTAAVGDTNLSTMLPMFMPWVGRWLPENVSRMDVVEQTYKPLLEFLPAYIEAHRAARAQQGASGSEGEPRPQNLIDAYLDEIDAGGGDHSSSFHPSVAMHSLVTTLSDLFAAGIETTTTTLSWICLVLAKYPEVQQKVAAEIKEVMGTQAPSLADRARMPYTHAMIHEVFRFRPLIPMGVFRSALEDTMVNGYRIAKGTIMFFNTYEAHFNEERWDGDPYVFRPERWLNAEAEFVRREGLLAFGAGKRVCLGEQMARDELYLFTVGLVQAFVIKCHGHDDPDLEPKLGGTTLAPKPQQLVFSARE